MNDAAANRSADLHSTLIRIAAQCSLGDSQTAALERLADALGSRDFATTLTTGEGRTPRLTVASRRSRLVEDIYASRLGYWWSWAERIGGVDDPAGAAQQIAAVLRTASEPAHD